MEFLFKIILKFYETLSIKRGRGRAADLLILNLVFADIGKILSNIPMAVISCIIGEWVFGQIGKNTNFV